MSIFNLEPTKRAEWQALVVEAQVFSGYQFEESLENYLVLTLDHFTQHNKLQTSVIALNFLEAIEKSGQESGTELREIGDQCLLISGLFPERALKKNVSLGYFVTIGKQAYEIVADKNLLITFDSELFYKLSDNFVGLMDLLHVMRKLPNYKDL